MIRILIALILLVPCISIADDFTQQRILDEVRGMRDDAQYNRTLDSWTDSIRRTNRLNQERNREWDRNERYNRYDGYDSDYESWQPDPDGGLVIPGGHFE